MKTAIEKGIIAFLALLPALLPLAHARPCFPEHAVTGIIGDKWRGLDGADGPLGCPTSTETDAEGPGRYQQFERGAIVTSPHLGPNCVHAAYVTGNRITVEWSGTSLTYQFFRVYWGFPLVQIKAEDGNFIAI